MTKEQLLGKMMKLLRKYAADNNSNLLCYLDFQSEGQNYYQWNGNGWDPLAIPWIPAADDYDDDWGL